MQRNVGYWYLEIDSAIKTLKANSLLKRFLKMAWNGAIYCIWKARNLAMHEASTPSINRTIGGVVKVQMGANSSERRLTLSLGDQESCKKWKYLML